MLRTTNNQPPVIPIAVIVVKEKLLCWTKETVSFLFPCTVIWIHCSASIPLLVYISFSFMSFLLLLFYEPLIYLFSLKSVIFSNKSLALKSADFSLGELKYIYMFPILFPYHMNAAQIPDFVKWMKVKDKLWIQSVISVASFGFLTAFFVAS